MSDFVQITATVRRLSTSWQLISLSPIMCSGLTRSVYCSRNVPVRIFAEECVHAATRALVFPRHAEIVSVQSLLVALFQIAHVEEVLL